MEGRRQAGDTARTLDSPEVLCLEPRVAEGPLLPFRRPSNVGRSEGPPVQAQSLRESRVRGGRARRPRQERANPPRELSQAMVTHEEWKCSQNTMDKNKCDGSSSTCQLIAKWQEKHMSPNNEPSEHVTEPCRLSPVHAGKAARPVGGALSSGEQRRGVRTSDCEHSKSVLENGKV